MKKRGEKNQFPLAPLSKSSKNLKAAIYPIFLSEIVELNEQCMMQFHSSLISRFSKLSLALTPKTALILNNWLILLNANFRHHQRKILLPIPPEILMYGNCMQMHWIFVHWKFHAFFGKKEDELRFIYSMDGWIHDDDGGFTCNTKMMELKDEKQTFMLIKVYISSF